jgi:hypothetical protein
MLGGNEDGGGKEPLMSAALNCAKDTSFYVLLCVAATLGGRGLRRLARLPVEGSATAALDPLLGLLFWVLALCVTAALRLPLRLVSPGLWAATALLAVYGLFARPRPRPSAGALLVWLACLLVPLPVMAGAFRQGLTECLDCLHMDGWIYMAGGHYVYEWGRNPYDGPNPILQVGSYFQEHRFATFALLGHLSVLRQPGDTLRVGALFQAWALFALACAVALFWLARGWRPAAAATAAALTAASGWVSTVVWGNWFEQELALTYMPAMAAVLALWPTSLLRGWAVQGCLLAGLLYTYPEAAPAPLLGLALIALPRLWAERRDGRPWLRGGLLALGLAALLLAPALPTLIRFTRSQSGSIFTHGGGTEWLVGGLQNGANYPSAFWGLGGETYAKEATTASNLAGGVLTALALLGLVRLFRRQDWGIAFAVVGATLAGFYWLIVLRHPYLLFKSMTLLWWALVYVVGVGGAGLVQMLPARLSRPTGLLLLLAAFGLAGWTLQGKAPFGQTLYGRLGFSAFDRLRELPKLIGKAAMVVTVNDVLAQQLAAFYLRDVNIDLATPQGWLAMPPMIEHRRKCGTEMTGPVSLVLTDWTTPAIFNDLRRCAALVHALGPYQVWQLLPQASSQPCLLAIHPLIGADRLSDGRVSFWVGSQDVTLVLVVEEDGILNVETQFHLGQTIPEIPLRTLVVETLAGYRARTWVAAGPGRLQVPVRAGVNHVLLSCPDKGTNRSLPPDEARLMLLGLMHTSLSFAPGGALSR